METLDNKDELIAHLHSLKQHPGYQYIASILTNWKDQAAGDMANTPFNDPKMPAAQADFKAYGRLLALPDRLIHDLTEKPGTINFDPYNQ